MAIRENDEDPDLFQSRALLYRRQMDFIRAQRDYGVVSAMKGASRSVVVDAAQTSGAAQSDDQIRVALQQQLNDFGDKAPLSAEEAATIILDGIRNDRWRILVGDDAHALTLLVEKNSAIDDVRADRLRPVVQHG